MKIHLPFILISILLFTVSCQEKRSDQSTIGIEKRVEQKKSVEPQQEVVEEKKLKELPKHYEHQYVVARSGLKYRDSPKGKLLGKFPLNTSLTILTHTQIADTINNEGQLLVGEWVGVQDGRHAGKATDTVYVFSGFLSDTWVQSDIKLYEALPFDETSGRIRTAFLNLSETYFEYAYDEEGDSSQKSIFTESDLEKDTIRLSKSQRKKFLKISNIKESEQVFVYFMASDSLQTYKVKDLSVIAYINPYGAANDDQYEELDYMLGFDLGKSITTWEDNLAYVGKENPFRTGALKPIIWEEIPNNQYPDQKEIDKKGMELTSYQFSTENYHYFLQTPSEGAGSYHLLIIDKETKSEVLNENFYDSEGTYLTGLHIAGNHQQKTNQSQWTGALLKHKATVVFGFEGYSFGCPSITVLDETEPLISIRCDNRH